MSFPRRLLISAVVAAALTVAAGCDSAPGVSEVDGVPPVISDFSFSPAFVDFATLPPEQRVDSLARVPFSAQASVRDEDGDLVAVRYVVQPLVQGDPPVLEGDMAGAGIVFSGEGTLEVPLGTIANFSVLVFAVDEGGHRSNQARGIVRFTSSEGGGPPVIEDVASDPEIVRPPTTFRLIATVSDPDGYANILRVTGSAPNGNEFSMLDDGVSFGDDVAGDGLFTARFDVPAAAPGTQIFRIQAFDRSGLSSEVFEKAVTIE